MIHRRQFSVGLLASLGSLACTSALARRGNEPELSQRFAEIEKAAGARLGIAVLDTGSGLRAGHRDSERFPMCSTFKLLAAAAILARVDQKKERLDRRIVFRASDLVNYSPVTEKRVGGAGMTLAEICKAAITQSDNTAGNLMLASIGGPAGLTRFARSIGDAQTRLDRTETALNEALPGDPRDTTTPAAMLTNMRKILLGDTLLASSRAELLGWLDANQTGGQRLRAGVPADWKVGDKTGSGDRGTANDIAILRPPGRAPILVTVYLTESTASMEARNATISSVGAAIAASS